MAQKERMGGRGGDGRRGAVQEAATGGDEEDGGGGGGGRIRNGQGLLLPSREQIDDGRRERRPRRRGRVPRDGAAGSGWRCWAAAPLPRPDRRRDGEDDELSRDGGGGRRRWPEEDDDLLLRLLRGGGAGSRQPALLPC